MEAQLLKKQSWCRHLGAAIKRLRNRKGAGYALWQLQCYTVKGEPRKGSFKTWAITPNPELLRDGWLSTLEALSEEK